VDKETNAVSKPNSGNIPGMRDPAAGGAQHAAPSSRIHAGIRRVRSGTAYRKVMADALRRIRSGEWRVGARIPTIEALTRIYPCSRMTVVRAVRELIASGYLATRGRAGTSVIKSGSDGCIGILSNFDFAHPEQAQFTHILTGDLHRRAARAGFDTRLYQEMSRTDHPDFPNAALRADISKGLLCGLLTAASNLPIWRQHHQVTFGIPCVDVNYFAAAECRVYVDYALMVRRTLVRLRQAGRCRVGLIGAPAEVRDIFQQSVRRLKMETRPEWAPAMNGCPVEEAGYRGMMSIWNQRSRPNSIFVADDVAAKGAAHAAMALGIAVPRRLLLLTLANRGIEYFYPCPVIRLEVDPAELAGAAVELLQKRLRDPELPPRNVLVAPCVRELSTGQPGSGRGEAAPGKKI
jgi:DNA-binding LacI/PurR family transcriptional regulator